MPVKKPASNKTKVKLTPAEITEDKAQAESEVFYAERRIESLVQPEKEGSKYMLAPSWLSEKQVLKMLQKTPADHVKRRPAKGGGEWDYVTGVYVTKVLNFTFGFLWDFDIVDEKVYGHSPNEQIVVKGKLTVRDSKNNTVTKVQFGRAEVKYSKRGGYLDIGNDFKAAATDALKKCASQLGIASDIYGKNEFREIAPEPVRDIIAPKKPGTENRPVACKNCAEIVDPEVARFSMRINKKVLCKNCQTQGIK